LRGAEFRPLIADESAPTVPMVHAYAIAGAD